MPTLREMARSSSKVLLLGLLSMVILPVKMARVLRVASPVQEEVQTNAPVCHSDAPPQEVGGSQQQQYASGTVGHINVDYSAS